MRVLLANHPQLLREGLQRVLIAAPGVEVVGQATDPIKLLLAVRMAKPDVVILNQTNTADLSGVCSQLLDEFPDLKIILMSDDSQELVVWERRPQCRKLDQYSAEELLAELQAEP